MSRPEVLAVHKACYSRPHSYSRLKKRDMMMSLGSPPWGSFLRPQYPTARETECLRHWDRPRSLKISSTHPPSNLYLSPSIKHHPLTINQTSTSLPQTSTSHPQSKRLPLTLSQTSISHPQSNLHLSPSIKTCTTHPQYTHPQSNILSPSIKPPPLTPNQTYTTHPQTSHPQ